MAIINGIIVAYISLTLPLVSYIGYKTYMRIRYPEKKKGPSGVTRILDAVALMASTCVAWFTSITNSQDILKRDNQAMLQATKAIAQSMLDIKLIAEKFTEKPTPAKNIETFLNSLEYVRDFYTKTQHQRKVVDVIISNIRTTTHGTESK